MLYYCDSLTGNTHTAIKLLEQRLFENKKLLAEQKFELEELYGNERPDQRIRQRGGDRSSIEPHISLLPFTETKKTA